MIDSPTKNTSAASSAVNHNLLHALVIFSLLWSNVALGQSDAPATKPNTSVDGAEDGVAVGATEINLKNAEISSIIRIFSRKTGRNYILDENVKGKVTIYLPGKIQTGEAIKILDSLLALKGFTSVPIGENLWKIVANKDAKVSTIPTLQGLEGEQSASAAMVTRIVGLKYSNADDVKQLITPLVSPEGLLNAYTGTNSLIIIDSQDNIDRVVGIISTLDVPSSDREMTIIPVINAEASNIAEKLNDILGVKSGGKEGGELSSIDLLRNRVQEGLMNAAQKNLGGPGGISNATFAGGKTVTARSREPKITADERTNSVIVIADEETTARIRALIAQLDSKLDRSGNKFYVYRCQHASAEQLSEVLSALGGGGSGSGSTGAGKAGNEFFGNGASDSGRAALGSSNKSKSKSRSQSRNAGQSRVPGQSRNDGKTKSGSSSASLGEDISITADASTNSLVIFASKTDYLKVLELLSQLDIKRRQVLVEATLLEVAIDGSLETGVSFMGSTGGADGGGILRNDNGSLTQLLRDPTSVQNFSAAAASAGSLTLPGGAVIPTQSILLSAAQSNRNVNVLSAPTILTTDNEEAEIVVGQNVPFVSSTSTNETNLNNTFNQVDRQDVGITLRLTPQISSGDFVTLKIFTEVSNIVPGTSSSTLGPTTTVRTSETTVITKDSQMVVIGGLMSDDLSDGETGIPFLKDIPVFGHLFKQNNSAHRKTNLLIFITPRVIKDQFDHREATIEARDGLDHELRANPDQPNRADVLHRDNISNVSETKIVDGPKPSTILPPLATVSNSSVKRNAALELRVQPKAPVATAEVTKQENGKIITEKQDVSIKSESPEQIAILKIVKGSSSQFAQSAGLVPVVIPEGAPQEKIAAFFAVGSKIQYDGSSFESVGILKNSDKNPLELPAALKKSNQALWYRLSPHELLQLGKGPWKKQ